MKKNYTMNRIMHNSIVAIFIALIILLQTPYNTKAQNKNAGKAIRDVVAKFEENWNKPDLDAFVKLFTPDADFTSPYGLKVSGRKSIRDYHGIISSGVLKIKVANISIKFYTNKVATVDCEQTISGFHGDDGKSLPDRQFLTLYIMKKESGQWLIAVQHVVMKQNTK